MKRSTLILLKTLTWVACLWPFALLVYGAVTNTLGPDPTANIALTTGYNDAAAADCFAGDYAGAEACAAAELADQIPAAAGAVCFLLCYGPHADVCGAVRRIRCEHDDHRHCQAAVHHHRRGGVAAAAAAGGDVDNWAIRKLGGKNWNRLHKLVYVAAICGDRSLLVAGEAGVLSPLRLTVVLGLLLLARPVLAWCRGGRCARLRANQSAGPVEIDAGHRYRWSH